jgi:hypothetical protein
LGLGAEGDVGDVPRLSSVEYESLVGGIREIVHRVVPVNAGVLVVSKGDEELLRLGPRQAMHFPQTEDGKYAGYHPSDSDSAIAMVEELRESKGADYLLLPSSSFWWLEHYDGFKRYLEQNYQVVESGDSCWIVHLSKGADLAADATPMVEAPSRPEILHPLREVVEGLLPDSATVAFLSLRAGELDGLEGHQQWVLPGTTIGEDLASMTRLEQSGIEFVVVPASIFDWVDEHPQVANRLRSGHRFITRQEHLCEIYELVPGTEPRSSTEAAGPIETASPSPSGAATAEPGPARRSLGEWLRDLFFSRRNGTS